MAVKNLGALGVLYTDRRDFYLDPNVVAELHSDAAPFTTLISTFGARTTNDPDFKMFEHRAGWIKQQLTVNAASPDAWSATGAPGGTVTVAVDGIVGLPATLDDSVLGYEVEIFTQGEGGTYGASKGHAIITAATASGVTLKSVGNAVHATFVNDALADNDFLLVCGNAKGEGTTAPEAYSDELEVVYNSCSIERISVEITGTLYQAALRGYSNELARLRIDKSKEAKMLRERKNLFGMRPTGIGGVANGAGGGTDSTFINHITDANGKTVRKTMGVIPVLRRYGSTSGDAQNIFNISAATYKYNSFVDDMEKVFQYLPDSGIKRAFCGARALSYWSKVTSKEGFHGNSGWNVTISDFKRDALGFNYRILETPHGLLQLIPTPVLRGPYANVMLTIDEANVQHVTYRPAAYYTNIKTDDRYDGVKDEYFFDDGVGMTLAESHSLWTIN